MTTDGNVGHVLVHRRPVDGTSLHKGVKNSSESETSSTSQRTTRTVMKTAAVRRYLVLLWGGLSDLGICNATLKEPAPELE